jgi:dihydropteroate synthase
MTPHRWVCRRHAFAIGRRPLVLGIVNVTPDSFSDGGQFFSPDVAIAHGLELARQGADLLDVGGESTRPQATPVLLEEELARVVPVVRELAARAGVPISVDTMKAEVARQALAAGAAVINDVTGLRGDPDMPAVVAQAGAGAIVMHMQGTPATMQDNPTYGDVVAEVGAFLEERLHALAAAGIAPECVALDPGIGFGKTNAHSLVLLAHLANFQRFGRPVCLGVSRKGLLGKLAGGRPVGERLAAGLAVVCQAQTRGAVQIVRVHDVRETRDAVAVCAAIDDCRDRPGA